MHTRATRGDDVAGLVTAARHGDPDAWGRLVEVYSGMLLARIRFLGVRQEDARDVLQNTWLLALQNLPHLRRAGKMGGWLTTIATRESIRFNRRSSEEICADPMAFGDVADDGADAHRAWAKGSFRRILDEVLGGLPADQRDLFRALTAQPRPHYVDVARRLGRPVGSIGPSRARCFGKVRVLLEARGVTADFLD
ncbi:MAG TPA: RNA polymerase sigma factor [Streptosporangiaceae bacterium]|jgi:RNA polymerase sigma factor (sigma-70 family)|nr:RNA polymerase sigma factor [Streptosporangiaceae bacterium]